MTSNDFIIRTERNVIEVVLSNESEIKALRRDFEDFKQNEFVPFKQLHNEQYMILTSNQQILSNKIDNIKDSLALMQNIFTWGFAAVAIGVAVAPIIKGWVESWKNTSLSEKISSLEAQIKDLQQKLS